MGMHSLFGMAMTAPLVLWPAFSFPAKGQAILTAGHESIVGVTLYGGIPNLLIEIGVVATLVVAVGVLFRRYRRILKGYGEALESEVKERTSELNEAMEELQRSRGELQHEVSELRAAEKQVRKVMVIQKAILDNIPDMVWLKDRDGRFLLVNAAFADTSGIPEEELIGKTDFDFWSRDLATRFQKDDQEVMQIGKRKRVEETLAREGSESTWIQTIKSPIWDETGQVIGTTGISRNVTEYVKNITEATVAKQKIETELTIAGDIQRNMLPVGVPDPVIERGIQLCADCRPVHLVGGDLYDYFISEDNSLYVIIGDVSGKGLSAALFMALTIALIRIKARDGSRPDDVLQTVNEEMALRNALRMFVTIFIGKLDLESGEFVFSNAGHNPPYVVPASGGCRELDVPRGRPLGLPGKGRYRASQTTLGPGDALFLYTDGVTEAEDSRGSLFGEKRLTDLLDDLTGTSAQDRMDRVFEEVASFSRGVAQSDDITALCLQLPRPVERSSRVDLHMDVSQIQVVTEAFENFAGDQSLADDVLADMRLALEEVVVNIINHGIDSVSGKISVLFRMAETTLVIVVTDDCRPFNPLEAEPYDKERRRKEKRIGGLGLYLVKKVCSSVEYRREGDKNVITLKRELGPRSV